MDLDKKHQDWEGEAPELAKMPVSNPFLVPKGYFEDLEETIHARIRLESLDLNKDPGFSVEAGYFESLPEKIEAAVALQQLKEEMTTEGFTVPAGYFEGLQDRISQKVQPQPKVRKLYSGWMNYAAAATITLAVAFGFLMNSNSRNFSAKLSKVPEQEIVNYLQLYSDQMDSQVIVENMEPNNAFSDVSEDVSAQELKYYLEDTSL